MNSRHVTTNQVQDAINTIPEDIPYSQEIRRILSNAWVQAIDDEYYWAEEGKPHLRTFLKTTPLGLAIVDLANAILDNTETKG